MPLPAGGQGECVSIHVTSRNSGTFSRNSLELGDYPGEGIKRSRQSALALPPPQIRQSACMHRQAGL